LTFPRPWVRKNLAAGGPCRICRIGLDSEREEDMGHWKCTLCGYEYHAPKPHETCPGCKEKCTFVDLSTDCRTNPDFCRIPEEGG
jgi:rubredoxin